MFFVCDITHPAHAHFFRPIIEILRTRGHRVDVVSRDKDLTIEILEEQGIDHHRLSRAGRGVIGLGLELLIHEMRLYARFRRRPPDLFMEIGGTFIVHAARLMGAPSAVFYDTEIASVSNRITYPFANYICTPDCYGGDLGEKHHRYAGFHELAYLRPNRFAPDPSVTAAAGLGAFEPFSLVRFVGWKSGHDLGRRGLSAEEKIRLIRELEKHGKVFVSSEAPLPPGLEPYRMPVRVSDIHHLLAYAKLYVGESATMASEACMLGVPAVLISHTGRGYTDRLEKRHRLCFRAERLDGALPEISRILNDPNSPSFYGKRRDAMLADTIDVASWVADFAEEAVRRNGAPIHDFKREVQP